MKDGYIPQDKRKKILLLADDIRMTSGISNASRLFVTGTAHRFNWAQIAGSVQHPEKGKIMILDQATKEATGVPDPYVRLYPSNGYGNPDILNEVIRLEKPNAILVFTDPRFWGWLWNIEREIRQKCPIAYLNIWDNLNYPMYNRAAYESCDLLLAISKQTLNINKCVLGMENCQTICGESFDENGVVIPKSMSPKKRTMLHYCPHGMDVKTFYPLTTEQELKDLAIAKKQLFPKKDFDFVLFYNSRNIRRKQTATILLAWRVFCDNLTKEQAARCMFLLHTQPLDDAGTDLPACREAFCPMYNVQFSNDRVMPEKLNQFYNIADVTIHLSDNEGFGIGTAESLAAGTPIITSVTGGLQDQCGFVDENGKPVEFTPDWGSNSDGRYKKHGKWVTPIYPGARMVQGSPPTPHIIGDYTRYEDAAEAMLYWYSIGREKRKECGLEGRRWLSNEGGLNQDNMCKTMIEGLEAMMTAWKGRERFNIHRHDEFVGHRMPHNKLGLIFPKFDKETVLEKFNNLKS